MSERTELEWNYEPADFFEAPYHHAEAAYDLVADGGRVTVILRAPQDPVNSSVEQGIQSQINDILAARQLQVHRKYRLEGPRIWQNVGDKRHVSIRVGSAALVMTGHRPDIVIADRNGAVIRDTKAERIAEETETLNLLVSKAGQHPTIRVVLQSYSRCVSDPDDELVHLYEVRDALSAHYGGEALARQALQIPKAEWKRLGVLANVKAIEQGRHRGKHLARRPATGAELTEAREIVRGWIMIFARQL